MIGCWLLAGAALLGALKARAHPDPYEYLQMYAQALEQNPNDTDALMQRATMHHSIGEYEYALQDLGRVIELEPDNGLAFFNRALVFADTGRADEADDDLDRAAALMPDNAKVYYYRGLIRYKTGRHQDALADFDRALERDADPNHYLARARAHEALKNYTAAVDDIGQAIALRPLNANYLVARARLCGASEVGRYEQALADYGKAIELFGALPELPLERGKLLARLGRQAEAAADLRRALDILDARLRFNPQSLILLAARAETLMLLGRNTEALADLDVALASPSAELAAKLEVNLDELERMRARLRAAQGP